VLVPVLADPYGTVLERGELELRFEPHSGSFAVYYQSHRLPLDPRTYPRILDRVAALVSNTELENIRRALAALPDRQVLTPEQVAERCREKQRHQQRLAALTAGNPEVAAAIEAAVRSFGGTPAEPASFGCAARAARAAGLPPRLLARRGRGHQLPAVLRCERSGGVAGRQ